MKELEKIVIEPKTSIISHLSQQMEVSLETCHATQGFTSLSCSLKAPPS
jgi:hypothetical protein